MNQQITCDQPSSPSWFITEEALDRESARLNVLNRIYNYSGMVDDGSSRSESVCSVHTLNGDLTRHDNSTLKLELLRKNESAEFQAIFEERKKLAVVQQCRDILRAISRHQVVLVVGRKGCGKSTQIPQMLLDDSIFNDCGMECGIICVQTRKDLAISTARRVAFERIESVGNSVGFQVGGRNTMPRQTGFILYCTAAVLIKQFKRDPLLRSLTVVILDNMRDNIGEFNHLMHLLKIILPHRPDLKIILLSITVSEDTFCDYFENYHAIYVHDTSYPIIMKAPSTATMEDTTPDIECAGTISDGEYMPLSKPLYYTRKAKPTSARKYRNLMSKKYRRLIKKKRENVKNKVRANYSFSTISIKQRRLSSISSPSSSNLQVAIIDRSDPHGRMSDESWLKLEEKLLDEIISSKWNDEKITFDGANWSRGVKIVRCANDKSLQFLKTTVESWPMASLEVIPRSELPLRTFARMWIPPPVPTYKAILTLIEKQNNDFDTKSWKITKCTPSKKGFGRDYRICVDGKSARKIRERHGRIKFGLNYIRIRIEGL